MKNFKLASKLAQIGNRSEEVTGAVASPLYFSTAFRHEGLGKSTGFDYIRLTNPTRALLEEAIADLEGGDAGFACSSGMAAIQTVITLFKSGDEIIVSDDLYGGAYRLFEEIYRKWGLVAKYVDSSQPADVEALITDQTKAIFLETPTNPLMIQSDIPAISAIAKAHDLLLIVDNTFYTPINQQPILEGADIVIHSATKYLAGHNDVLAGLIVVKGEELVAKIAHYHNGAGGVLSPFDSYQVMRGMKTLALRMKAQVANAKELVAYLASHEAVADVIYPGNSGMISFRIRAKSWVDPFLQGLKLITFAESLGGVESFITYPTTQTHADMPEDVRFRKGICERLLRFSVGIEDVEDLIMDLESAFEVAKKGR